MLRHFLRRTIKINFSASSATLQSNAYSTKQSDLPPKGQDWPDEDLDDENPVDRTVRVLRNDFRRLKRQLLFWKDHSVTKSGQWDADETIFPGHVDILVIGGGAIGSSVAYWLKERADDGLRVAVVERDPTYKRCSSTLSVGGLRQQFSLEENIEMSLFGADFIRNADVHLGIPGDTPVDLQFHPHGYLFLATEAGAETLCQNSKLQNSLGAKNIILTAEQLRRRFPWLNTDGIAVGCLGLEKEGWFDPWALLYAFKKKSMALGVDYVTGSMEGFTYKNMSNVMIDSTDKSVHQGLSCAVIKLPDGRKKLIRFAVAVIAAGAHSAEIARMAGVGVGEGVLSVPLPVEPRKRFVYCFHSPNGPGLNTPLTVDPCGAYFRREGLAGHYVAGRSPEFENEPDVSNLDVDDKFFDDQVWPKIANRVKAFENLKVKSSWAGYYEYNKFDENGIIGQHPYHKNLFFATGFSGHGIQQAPAVGRAMTELIIDTNFLTIDLTRLGFDRFITLEPIREANIV